MKTKTMENIKYKADISKLIKGILIGVLSFLSGTGGILAVLFPFPYAVCATVPIRYLLPVCIGSISSVIFFQTNNRPLLYVIIITIILLLRTLLERFFKFKLKYIASIAIAISVSAILSLVYILLNATSPFITVMIFLEVLLTGTFSYMFLYLQNSLKKENYTFAIDSKECIATIAVMFSVISALSSIKILNINIGIILSVIIVIIASNLFKMQGAAVFSIAISGILMLSMPDIASFCWLLIFSSIISSCFARLGKIAISVAFITFSLFTLLLNGFPVLLTHRVIEAFIGIAISLIIPIGKFSAYFENIPNSEKKENTFLLNSFKYTENIFSELTGEVEKIYQKFIDIDNDAIVSIYDFAYENNCRTCSEKYICWQKRYSETIKSFNPISDYLRTKGIIEIERLPKYLIENCTHTESIVDTINSYYKTFVNHESMKRNTQESRNLLLNHLTCYTDIFAKMQVKIEETNIINIEMTNTLKDILISERIDYCDAVYLSSEKGQSKIEIFINDTTSKITNSFIKKINKTFNESFTSPIFYRTNNISKITLLSTPIFQIDFSVKQYNYSDNSVCGDSYNQFYDDSGNLNILLSDGMGNGKRAAVDSTITCSIISKLLKSGISLKASLKILSSVFQAKSTDETIATLDILTLDLYNGQGKIYKLGSAASYIYSKGKITKINPTSLPIGIFQTDLPNKIEFKYRSGDIILMVSDGAIQNGDDILAKQLLKTYNLSAEEISTELCNKIIGCMQNAIQDDITVIAIKIK